MTAKASKPKPDGRSIFGAAARSKDFFDHLEAHYRECKRRKVDIDASISIITENGEVFDTGSAKVSDVSPTGAMLAHMKLNKETYPAKPFTIEMKMRSGGYEGITFRCKPVRFVPDVNGIGVKFEEVYVRTEGPKTE